MRTKVKQDIASETSYLQLEIVYVLYCVSDSKEVFDMGMPVSRLTWGILQSTKKDFNLHSSDRCSCPPIKQLLFIESRTSSSSQQTRTKMSKSNSQNKC